MQKTVLITGANKGIGLEVARQLATLKYRVFLSARNKERGENACASLREIGLEVDFIQLDVSDPDSIQNAVQLISNKIKRLDVLVNNAGVLYKKDQDLMKIPDELVENTFKINTLGPLRVTRQFEPLLGIGSRVINVSSGGGAITEELNTFAPVYCASKTGVNAVTMQLAVALEVKGILVNAICPGWVRTDMGGEEASRSVEKGAETIVWMACEKGFDHTGLFFRDKKVISW